MRPAVRLRVSASVTVLVRVSGGGEAGAAVVLAALQGELAVTRLQGEEVRLHPGERLELLERVPLQSGPALLVELLPQRLPLLFRHVGQVNDLDAAEVVAERRAERRLQVGDELLAGDRAEGGVRGDAQHHPPGVRGVRLRIDARWGRGHHGADE